MSISPIIRRTLISAMAKAKISGKLWVSLNSTRPHSDEYQELVVLKSCVADITRLI